MGLHMYRLHSLRVEDFLGSVNVSSTTTRTDVLLVCTMDKYPARLS